VVKAKNLDRELLLKNAQKFLSQIKEVNQKKKENNLEVDDSLSLAKSRGSFLVYTFRSPDGEIKYNISIQVKDEKYRYQINQFVFHRYTRNRYGRYEIDRWHSKHLEEAEFKGQQNNWEKHKATTLEKMNALILDMKTAMTALPQTAKKKKKKKVISW